MSKNNHLCRAVGIKDYGASMSDQENDPELFGSYSENSYSSDV